ncbi:MAG TPA: flagellar hook-basal body complex protein FliE [Bacillales bacterium]|nr:flagellar hook-basal body complex protein FliE [Bacillales bacterium]
MNRINPFPVQPTFSQQNLQKSPTSPAEAGDAFADMLNDAISEVNEAQIRSKQATQALINGEAVSLHDVMIAGEKATLTLTAAVEIRNKVIDAYHKIMRMQV